MGRNETTGEKWLGSNGRDEVTLLLDWLAMDRLRERTPEDRAGLAEDLMNALSGYMKVPRHIIETNLAEMRMTDSTFDGDMQTRIQQVRADGTDHWFVRLLPNPTKTMPPPVLWCNDYDEAQEFPRPSRANSQIRKLLKWYPDETYFAVQQAHVEQDETIQQ